MTARAAVQRGEVPKPHEVPDQAPDQVLPAWTRALLSAPALPLLLRLVWPNVLVSLAQASTGLIETWWISGLGTDALAGMALVLYYAVGAAVLAWYVLSGRNPAQLRLLRLRWPPFRDILRVGAFAALSPVLTNLVVGGTTALVATAAGPEAVAGYGVGARLEYLLIPLVFGFGAPLVAVGGGWVALRLTGSLTGLFAMLCAGLVLYGLGIALAVARGAWDAPETRRGTRHG